MWIFMNTRDVLGKSAVIKWWHGDGSLLDYSNPAAVDWWHEQLDKVVYRSVMLNYYITSGSGVEC
jgi:alpha-glucosidase (family GH31 glycosyl hydrolase)